jgi:hypothetical protein
MNKGILLIGRFALLTIVISLEIVSATPSHATIFWDDEMEPGNTGYSPVPGAMSFDSSIKFSGAASIRLDYPSVCYPDASAQSNCGGFMDRRFTGTTTFYRRFYIRLSSGFTVSDVFTKLMRSDTTGPNSNWWVLGCCGSKQVLVSDQNVPTVGSSVNYYTQAVLQDGSWHCMETLEQLNTPGVPNGVAMAWIDGVQVMNQAGITYRQAGDNSLFSNNRLYRQTGTGSIWYDRVAVADERIGCSGATNAGITPPAVPTGLMVR